MPPPHRAALLLATAVACAGCQLLWPLDDYSGGGSAGGYVDAGSAGAGGGSAGAAGDGGIGAASGNGGASGGGGASGSAGTGSGCGATGNSGGIAGASCAIPITALRDPKHPAHPAEGSQVKVAGLYVTALRSSPETAQGFYAQDKTVGPFTGIFVFMGPTAPNVAVGNEVALAATYSEYNGLSSLVDAVVTVTNAGTTLPFGPIAIKDPNTVATNGAQAEGYESMLLSIISVEVTVMNPDAPQDHDEFVVSGGLRIDDELSPTLDNTYAVGKKFSKITGILSYNYDNTKLLPRDVSELME